MYVFVVAVGWGGAWASALYRNPAVDRETDTTENITFATPLAGSN